MIVDTDAGKSKRKITAFLGGLDLCGGRYDNQEHPLFRTLQSLHKDDYYNPAFAVIFHFSSLIMFLQLDYGLYFFSVKGN